MQREFVGQKRRLKSERVLGGNMGIPQIIVIGLIGLNLGASLMQHGSLKMEEHNFFTELISKIILTALLIWGGFFG